MMTTKNMLHTHTVFRFHYSRNISWANFLFSPNVQVRKGYINFQIFQPQKNFRCWHLTSHPTTAILALMMKGEDLHFIVLDLGVWGKLQSKCVVRHLLIILYTSLSLIFSFPSPVIFFFFLFPSLSVTYVNTAFILSFICMICIDFHMCSNVHLWHDKIRAWTVLFKAFKIVLSTDVVKAGPFLRSFTICLFFII